ncbi:MAG TPA: FGGY family carbohydrate kinase [Bacillota bacterium]
MNVVGLEVSTSAAKAVLFSRGEGVLATSTIPFDGAVSDTVSQDPDGVVEAALQALAEITLHSREPIAGIGLGGTWHSLLLLDKEYRPLERVHTWADLSASSLVSEVRRDSKLVEWFYQRTGCMVHAMYPLWKYLDIKRRRPELVEKTAYLGSSLEYLFMRLTGRQCLSKCLASGSGWFNIRRLDWDSEILDYAGVDPGQLGELKELPEWAPLTVEAAARTGLLAGIPVTVGGADGAMNQIGIGGVIPGIMSFSVGTSGALRITQSEPKLPVTPSTWCYYLYDGKRLAGAATHACSNLDWFLSNWNSAKGKGYDQYAQEAALIERENAPYFLPFIYGERCPGWREDRSGGFLELRAGHRRADLYYAVLEGILFNLYQCYRSLTATCEAAAEIRISGGIMNSPFWLQLAADIFGREITATSVTNDSTVGAALFALEASGGLADVAEYRPALTDTVQPRAEFRELLERRFQHYLTLYQANG